MARDTALRPIVGIGRRQRGATLPRGVAFDQGDSVATKRTLMITFLGLALSACATGRPPVVKECFHENAASEGDIGYCRAVRVGNVLYLSGTAGQGDMASAIQSVYGRLQKTLEQHGLSYADVVKEVVYATDLDAFIQHRDLRKAFYGPDLPAATWVQVQRLYTPSFVVEVELTAVDRRSMH